jgi:hypothetical protein
MDLGPYKALDGAVFGGKEETFSSKPRFLHAICLSPASPNYLDLGDEQRSGCLSQAICCL